MNGTRESSEKLDMNIGFIGAGNMAKAIAIAILNSGIVGPKQIYACAPTMRNLNIWSKDLKVNVTHDSVVIIEECEVVFLAMKPYQLNEVIDVLQARAKRDYKVSLFISVLAATSLDLLRSKLDLVFSKCDVIRVIPNTSLEVGEGCSVMCSEKRTPPKYIDLAKKLLLTGGICEEIPENLMSIASALSGSGPAFIYVIIEALADGAVKKGLSRELSYKLAAQMIAGAAKMVLKTGEHPAKLKDNVCSPNGTTICGIHALEKSGVRAAMINALEATAERSIEMNKSNKQD